MSKLHALAKWKCTRIILLMKVRQCITEGVHICVHWQYLKSNIYVSYLILGLYQSLLAWGIYWKDYGCHLTSKLAYNCNIAAKNANNEVIIRTKTPIVLLILQVATSNAIINLITYVN